MNQMQSGNCAYYDNSYSGYQSPSVGQWSYDEYSRYSQPNTPQSYNNETYQYTSQPMNHGTNYSMNTTPRYRSPCMGRCNPPKLYAETYCYLTENLMKPVIEEVYQDLKSITSANTVANNAIASKMGLTQGQPTDQSGQTPSQPQNQAEAQNFNQGYGTQGQIGYSPGQMAQGTAVSGNKQTGPPQSQITQQKSIQGTLNQGMTKQGQNAGQLGASQQNGQRSLGQGRMQANAYSVGRNGLA